MDSPLHKLPLTAALRTRVISFVISSGVLVLRPCSMFMVARMSVKAVQADDTAADEYLKRFALVRRN